MAERWTFFATCAPGVEPVLHSEVRGLGLAKSERQVGGVRFEGEDVDGWRANLWLRTAVRVLQRLVRFPAADADALYAGARRVDWARYVRPDGTLLVDAQTNESALDHTQFIAQRVKDAVADQLRARAGRRPSVDKADPDLRIHVHLYRDRATLSVDTSGASLHKRGWRRYQGPAPLAETLAAAVVQLAGWDRRAPLLDPFCGSGTVLVEAALWAAGAAPGLARQFGFERWPGHDAARYAALRRQAQQAARPLRKVVLRGSDASAAQVAGARDNLAAAGLLDAVELQVAPVQELAPRRGWNGWVVTNPPYGERVGHRAQLEQLYADFGALLRQRCGGFTVGILSGDPELAARLELEAERLPLCHGGLACELLRTRLP